MLDPSNPIYTTDFSMNISTQFKTSADIFIDYCGMIQNFEEQCRGIFTADIYLKICEDDILNKFDNFIPFIFTEYLKIKITVGIKS